MKEQETPSFELMYRAPGRPDHQNVTEILDEVILRLEKIEQTLQEIESN